VEATKTFEVHLPVQNIKILENRRLMTDF